MFGLKLVPLSLVAVSKNDTIKVNHGLLTWGGNILLLGGRDHGVKEFNLILKDLNKFDDATVANVESSVERKDSRIIFGIEVQFRNILRTNKQTCVLSIGVHGRDNTNTLPAADGEGGLSDWELSIVSFELINESMTTYWTKVAFNLHAVRLCEVITQGPGD